jgi:hypothetical protein
MRSSTRLLAAVAVAAVLSQSSPGWAQTGPNLVIAMHHTGNFTVGVPGIYTIVVSNIGGTASTGQIEVTDDFAVDFGPPLFNSGYVSAVGAGWSCLYFVGFSSARLFCDNSGVIAAGASAPPITLTVLPFASGSVTNTACFSGGNCASDPTIILAAVPTLPQWALIALTVCLVLAGVVALRRRTP